MSYIDAENSWRLMTGITVPYLDNGPAEVLQIGGQSLSLGVIGTSIQKNDANAIDRHGVKMPAGLRRGDNGGAVYINGPMTAGYDMTAESTGLEPAAAGGNIALVQYVGQALRKMRASEGLSNPQIVAGCNGIGGQSISAFHDDPAQGSQTQWGNLIWEMRDYWIKQAWQVLDGRTRSVPYLGFVQGEADSNAPQGFYANGMNLMWDTHLAQIYAATGQTPIVSTTQVGGYVSSTANTKKYFVCTEQVEVVESRGGIVLPTWYPYLLWDNNVHPGDVQQREVGTLIAHHYLQYELGKKIPAFKPTARLIGNQLILEYALRDGDELEFAPDKYAAYGGGCDNYGFEVEGATINSVTIGADKRSVVIDCSDAPTAWAYAFQFQDMAEFPDAAGYNYSAHRGLLRKRGVIQPLITNDPLYEWALSWRGNLT